MGRVTIRVTMRPGPIGRVTEEAAEMVAQRAAVIVQTGATRRVPVDTGRLRASIATQIVRPGSGGAPVAALIGSEVEYALPVEADQPWLRPALDDLRGTFEGGTGGAVTDNDLVSYTRRDGTTRTATRAQARNWSGGAQG